MAWPSIRISLCFTESGERRRDADLLVDEVDAGDHLRHRMLDLNTGVHLDKIELAVLEQELDGAGAGIFQLLHRLRHDFADAPAHLRIEGGEGPSSQTFWWRR